MGTDAAERAGVRRAEPVSGERRRELLTYLGYRAAEWAINALPRGIVLSLAAAAGNVAFDLGRAKREVICENLAHAFDLPPRHRRVQRAARRAFRNYGKYLVDMMRIGQIDEAAARRLVEIENVEILDEAREEGRGVLLCTVHVGGMDMLGPGLKLAGEPMHVIADDSTYGRLYDHLAAVRARHGIHLIGWRSLRGLYRVLRGGGSLALFCDGGYRRGDVPVEFLGEATTFPVGPAALAARSGARIVPVVCRRTADDRFQGRGLPLIRATSDEPAEIHRATQELANVLGAVIADDPGQWYMFRPVWPQTDGDRAQARAALEAARRGEDWTRLPEAPAA